MNKNLVVLTLVILSISSIGFAASPLVVESINNATYTGQMLRNGNNGQIFFTGDSNPTDISYGSLSETNGTRTFNTGFTGSGLLYLTFASHPSSQQNYTSGIITITYNGSLIQNLTVPNITISAGEFSKVLYYSADGRPFNDSNLTQPATNSPPVLNSIGNKNVNENATLSFTVSGTDPDGDTTSLSVSNIPEGASFNTNTGVFVWTPNFTQSGNHTVTFSISDGTLVDNETIIITVNNVNQIPVLNSIGNKTISENSTLQFTINATDTDGDTVTYSASGLPSNANFDTNTGVFVWTPNITQSGNYSITFSVHDGSLNDSETIIIQVNDTNKAPLLNSVGNKFVNENSTLAFTLNASDQNGDSITFSSSTLPPGATLHTNLGIFLWTPNFTQSGNYTVTFFVSDGSLNDSETINIEVNNTNRVPVLNSIGNKSVNENSTLQFNLSATDDDGDSIIFSSSSRPFGASLNSTGFFSWTPGFNESGSFVITFFASDGLLNDSETITISVNNTNRAPSITAVGNQTVVENSTLQFTVNATDPDGENLSFGILSSPPGASFNNNTGLFTWTPNFTQSGNYTVTFLVSDGDLGDLEIITITVLNINSAPVLVTIGNKSTATEQNINFTINATDPDNDNIIFTASNLPIGASLNSTGFFSWTPNSTQTGTFQITFNASDGTSSDTETISIVVTDSIAPNITIISFPASGTTGESVNILVSATDNSNESLTAIITINNQNFSMTNNGTNAFNFTINIPDNSTFSIIYNVTISDSTGSSATTSTQTLVVSDNDSPKADFTFNLSEEGQVSIFASNSTDNIGILSLLWIFGDGTNSTISNVNKTYIQNGTFTVRLNVTDAAGNTDQKEVNITISDTSPVVNLTANATLIEENQIIQFNETSTAYDNITARLWSFGDGENSTAQNPSHNYTLNGTYTVLLTITDSDGSIASKNITITVGDSTPTAVINFNNTNLIENASIQFTGINSSGFDAPLSFLWNFGDGTTSNLSQPNKTYLQNGNYVVNLIVTDSDGSNDSTTVNITIADTSPVANFTSPQTGVEGESIQFNDTSTAYDNISSRLWDFGDGTNSTLNNPNHTYMQNGTYSVNLTVTDSDGSISSILRNITINDSAPNANAGINITVELGESVQFNATNTNSFDNISLYLWDFGDGTNGTGIQINHTFNTTGAYNITLTVIDIDSSVGIHSIIVTVVDTKGPEITIQTPENITHFKTEIDLNFTAKDLSNVSSCSLSFNNITISNNCSNTTLNNLSQGIQNITIFSNDSLGNNNTITSQFIINFNSTITGTIKDSTNATVENVTIQIKQGSNVIATAETDANGTFMIKVSPGVYNIVISKTGFIQITLTNIIVTAENQTVLPNITLSAGVSELSGTVVDVNGTLLENVTINIDNQSVQTNSNGSFSLTLSPGIYNISANLSGYFTQKITNIVVLPNSNLSVILKLTPIANYSNLTANISGSIRDPMATPLNATVNFTGNQSTSTNATNGFYNLTLDGGLYNSSATNTCYLPQTITNILIKGNESNTQNFVLYHISSELSVRINDSFDGINVSEADIGLLLNGTVVAQTKSSLNGSFDLTTLGGVYTLTISKTGYVAHTEEISLICGDLTKNISLVPLGNLSGILTNGGPATVELRQNGSVVANTTAETNGSYLITAPVGTYELVIRKSGFTTSTESVVIIKGQINVTSTLTPTGGGGSGGGSGGGGGGTAGVSGGGGGGGSQSTILPGSPIEKEAASLIQFEETIQIFGMNPGYNPILINTTQLPLIRIAIVNNVLIDNTNLVILKLKGLPSRIQNLRKPHTYMYISILKIGEVNNSAIERVEFEFRVERAWENVTLDENEEVSMYRYNETNKSWDILPTVYLSSDSKYNYYRSISPGFSYFGIAAKEKQAQATKEPQQNQTEDGRAGSGITGAFTGLTSESILLLIGLLIIALIIFAALYLSAKRSK